MKKLFVKINEMLEKGKKILGPKKTVGDAIQELTTGLKNGEITLSNTEG